MITITVNTTGVVEAIQKAGARITSSVGRAVSAAAIDLQSYIKTNKLHGGTPLFARSGNLSRAVQALQLEQFPGGVRARVVVDRTAPYGLYQEYGVPHPWTIEPKRAKVLAFEVGGKLVFAKKVTHPGLKERSFMRSGLADKHDAIVDRIRAAVKGAGQ